MRSEGKKRTLELSLIQGFSKIEKITGAKIRTFLIYAIGGGGFFENI